MFNSNHGKPDFKKPPKPKKKRSFLKRVPLKRKFKPSGELRIFKEMWNSQKHICEKCGIFLPEFSHSLFHHRKPKGRHPELRLVKSNIMLICFDCHFKIHNT